jgi:Flp pilus assembly secretin CpaC
MTRIVRLKSAPLESAGLRAGRSTARSLACAFALALLLSTIRLTMASPAASASMLATDETVTLMLGSGSTLALERPFEAVLIGDPNVVDVHTIGDRQVLLEPLKLGTSNVVFIDRQSVAITNIRVVVREART